MLPRIAIGDSSAVNECISLYGGLVWSLARRFTRTAADAEDATQEIFISVWRHAKVFDPAKGTESGFITTLARRRLIDRRRKLNSEVIIDSSVDVTEALNWIDSGTSSQTQLDADRAITALGRLRPDRRRVLERAFIHGLTQSEISTELSIPLGTVKSQMRRGLMQVRELLQISTEQLRVHQSKPASPIIEVMGLFEAKVRLRRAPGR